METKGLQPVEHHYNPILNKVPCKEDSIIFYDICRWYDFTNSSHCYKKFKGKEPTSSLQNVTSHPQFVRYLTNIFTKLLKTI